ncbi:DUF192 domain-containing protein [Candidatus Kaiserbacteria bacterium]|nr:DUF192 domain-containing protein [Candidatus Kaiserbacteria bacterium]MCB9811312.1 DUF192 domain-containing protein [Candidatus Nomurabacteria bacterium]
MSSIRQILWDTLIFVAVIGTILFLYQLYGGNILNYLFGEPRQTIFIDDLSIQVSYADTPDERQQGLSGVSSLRDREGKLFFFDQEGYYYMWMKDMKIPLDIFWINNDLKVVHIEENVRPENFPARYTSTEPARFVLEMNAFFAQEHNISVGSLVTIPAADLPTDLRQSLQ